MLGSDIIGSLELTHEHKELTNEQMESVPPGSSRKHRQARRLTHATGAFLSLRPSFPELEWLC